MSNITELMFMVHAPYMPYRSNRSNMLRGWIVFLGRPNEGCVPTRQVAFSSNNREVFFLNFGFSKSKMSVQDVLVGIFLLNG